MVQLRSVGLIALGIAIGVVLGGVPAQRELVAVREAHLALKQLVAQQGSRATSLLETILPRLDEADEPPPPALQVADAGIRPDPEPTANNGQVTVPHVEPAHDRSTNVLAEFDRVATVQRARTIALRSSLIAQAGLDDDQVARLTQLTTAMNDQLVGYGEELADQVLREEAPTPRVALGLGHDVSGILLEGQKALEQLVGDAEHVEPDAMTIWNYVDIGQWRPFVEARAQKMPTRNQGSAGHSAPPSVSPGDRRAD